MKAKPVLIGFLAVVVVIAAASAYMAATIDRAEKQVVAVAAPDNKYKAVRVTFSNDGAAPFCVDTISIFLTVYPDSFAETTKTYEVYGAPCTEPAKRKDLPKIEWTSNAAVKIAYAASAGKAPRMKAQDASKFVDVTFVKQD